MRILLLDNYDSFTYNLLHYLEQLCPEVDVRRNDAIALSEVEAYTHIVISPGPGLPAESGITPRVVERFFYHKPLLGICLGFQALGEFAGGELYNQREVAHGIRRMAHKTGESWLLKDLPEEFATGLYHSWAIRPTPDFNAHFRITARRDREIAMAMEHQDLPVAGVQFHPESIMSEQGLKILENWLERSAIISA